ncbi:MAG: hypothetical protein DMD81_27845 [Candidatus Rokuibacteriota bacterium]|nr:MAG: hypothetical protein DMD81_27845 [Candidatus Rokubacteria bacterium]
MTGTDYGSLSLFRDPTNLDGERARELAFRNLEARGKSPDEVAARAEYLDLLGLQPGQRVLDVGCGSGVVTRDMARRVSPSGRAVGVDPSRRVPHHRAWPGPGGGARGGHGVSGGQRLPSPRSNCRHRCESRQIAALASGAAPSESRSKPMVAADFDKVLPKSTRNPERLATENRVGQHHIEREPGTSAPAV